MVTISMKYFQNQTLKKRSYGLDTILLQSHAVTLTFKVATQMLRMHIVHIATYSCTCTKFHAPSFNRF